MKKHWDLEADRALQVTLSVSSADKPARDVVVVKDFGTFRFTLYDFMTADVAPSGIIIFFLLADTQTLHRAICRENRDDFCFVHNERVKELGYRVLFDFHHSSLVKVIQTRCEDGRCCAHFVLLGVSCVLHPATGRFKNGLKVRIDDEWCFSTILVLVEFDLRLLRAWIRKHMKDGHEVISGAKLFVSRENFF